MDTFKATKVEDKRIELKSSQDLEKVYDLLEKNENFILQWTNDEKVMTSSLIIATNIIGQVKNGEIELVSNEPVKEE